MHKNGYTYCVCALPGTNIYDAQEAAQRRGNMILNKLILKMIQYYHGDPKRIQHFIKVYEYARLIGQEENLDDTTQFTLETAAIVHDIGIKPAEEKYGSCSGSLQEKEGPAAAKEMLSHLDFPPQIIERVCYLVGHHHTYSHVDGLDYRILIEADFLVNLFEDNLPKENIQTALERVFETKTGRCICQTMFLE